MKVLLVLALALVAGASARKRWRDASWEDTHYRLNLDPNANKFVGLDENSARNRWDVSFEDSVYRLNLNPSANKFVGLHDIPRPFTSSNDPVSSHSQIGSVSVEQGDASSRSSYEEFDRRYLDDLNEQGRGWHPKNTGDSVDNSASDSEEGRHIEFRASCFRGMPLRWIHYRSAESESEERSNRNMDDSQGQTLLDRRAYRATGQPFVNQAGYVDGSKLAEEPCDRGFYGPDDTKLFGMRPSERIYY